MPAPRKISSQCAAPLALEECGISTLEKLPDLGTIPGGRSPGGRGHAIQMRMDSETHEATSSEWPRKNPPAEEAAYKPIGDALSCAESTYFRVGIPWLPPTARVKRLRSNEEWDLEEYLKIQLVGVKTVTLREYIDDLRRPELDAADRVFALQQPSLFERHSFSVITFLSIIGGVVLFASSTGVSTISASTLSGICGGAAAMFASVFSTDAYRRESFAHALEHEVSRREGQGASGANNLQVCPSGG